MKQVIPTIIANCSVTLKRQIIREMILGGQMVTVEWVTKSGSITKANGRTGVKKHLVKPENRKRKATTKAKPDHIETIYKNGKGYRSITLDNVLSVKAKGQKVYFT